MQCCCWICRLCLPLLLVPVFGTAEATTGIVRRRGRPTKKQAVENDQQEEEEVNFEESDSELSFDISLHDDDSTSSCDADTREEDDSSSGFNTEWTYCPLSNSKRLKSKFAGKLNKTFTDVETPSSPLEFVILDICTCNQDSRLFYKYVLTRDERVDENFEYSPCIEIIKNQSNVFAVCEESPPPSSPPVSSCQTFTRKNMAAPSTVANIRSGIRATRNGNVNYKT